MEEDIVKPEAVGPILTAKWSCDMKSRDMTSRNMKFSFS